MPGLHRLGIRWLQNGPLSFSATFTGNSPSSPANNNRVDGLTYDAAGNLLNDGVHSYFYDAENRLIQVDGTLGDCSSTSTLAHATACYYYDANGRRVWRTGFTNDHNCGGDTTGQRGYIYDLAGRWLSSVNKVSGTSCLSEIYAGSRHVASDNGDTTLDHTDWLGTSRVRTDYQYTSSHGFWIGQSCTSLPFGDGLDCSSSNYFALHFTGKERDSESGLDNFGARYSSSSLGRFMSADWSSIPVAVPYANLTNPQTLNLYALVADNPETFADLDGHGGCASLEVSTTCSWDAYQEGLAGDVIEGWQCNKKDICDPAGDRQAPNDQNAQEAKKQNTQPSQASAGVLALGIGARALLGAEEGGEAGAAAGTVEPGGGNVIGAVIGAAAGAAAAALAPTIYSKSKEAFKKVGSQLERALDHVGKLNGPDQNPDPRRGWKQTIRDAANQIDKQAGRISNQNLSNAVRYTAQLLRGLVD